LEKCKDIALEEVFSKAGWRKPALWQRPILASAFPTGIATTVLEDARMNDIYIEQAYIQRSRNLSQKIHPGPMRPAKHGLAVHHGPGANFTPWKDWPCLAVCCFQPIGRLDRSTPG
jgi:hypothetical protein